MNFNRPLKILNKSFDSTIPHNYKLQDIDCDLINKVNNALKEYLDEMSKCKLVKFLCLVYNFQTLNNLKQMSIATMS